MYRTAVNPLHVCWRTMETRRCWRPTGRGRSPMIDGISTYWGQIKHETSAIRFLRVRTEKNDKIHTQLRDLCDAERRNISVNKHGVSYKKRNILYHGNRARLIRHSFNNQILHNLVSHSTISWMSGAERTQKSKQYKHRWCNERIGSVL